VIKLYYLEHRNCEKHGPIALSIDNIMDRFSCVCPISAVAIFLLLVTLRTLYDDHSHRSMEEHAFNYGFVGKRLQSIVESSNGTPLTLTTVSK